MQVFLPYLDSWKIVKCLDSKRLIKQILEAYQIITGRVPNVNHPCVLMWRYHKSFLKNYIYYACKEYTVRYGKIHNIQQYVTRSIKIYPSWLTTKEKYRIILSHRVNLLRKDYNYYKEYWPEISLKSLSLYPEGYYWPVCLGETSKKHTLNWSKYGVNILDKENCIVV